MGCPTPIGPRPRFIPAPLVAQVTMQYFCENIPCENVYHFLGAAEWDSTSLAALATYCENWESATGSHRRGTSVQLHATIAAALVSESAAVIVSSVSIDGTVASELLPNNVTLAIKMNTNRRGRSYRGRTYWIGLTRADQSAGDSNMIDPSSATVILNAMNSLMVGAIPNGGQLAVLSYANDCTWRAAGVATVVTRMELTDPVFDSQRRRLPAHNIHH